jgi:hypothetical protein
MFFIKRRHQSRCNNRRLIVMDETKNILLFTEPNSFADKIKKFGNRQVSWDEIPTTSQQE